MHQQLTSWLWSVVLLAVLAACAVGSTPEHHPETLKVEASRSLQRHTGGRHPGSNAATAKDWHHDGALSGELVHGGTREDVGIELCGVCIQVSVVLINEILNIIANEGIVADCTTLCGKLPEKAEQVVCDAACLAVGLDELIHIIERIDLDPIWYCELVKLCPVVDCRGQCLQIQSFNVTPSEVSLGKKTTASVTIQVFNNTGTGMTRVDVYNTDQPKEQPLQNDFLEVGYEPGMYRTNIEIDTSQETQFWNYQTGHYRVQVWFCEGECGSQHPHSKIYDVANATFVITN